MNRVMRTQEQEERMSGIHGNFWRRGAATSLRTHETMRERAKRPQYARRADRREMPDATDVQSPQVQDAQHDAKHDAAHIDQISSISLNQWISRSIARSFAIATLVLPEL